MTTTQTSPIVAFHVGRGGRFHNPGYLSFIGEKEIGDFTNDLFLNYENVKDFKKRFGFDSTGNKNQRCILDLITDEDFDELQEKFGITKEDLGDSAYYDGGGNPVGLTEEEANKGIGRINIDNDYDTTYTCILADCDEDELKAILEYSGYVSAEIISFAKESLGVTEEED